MKCVVAGLGSIGQRHLRNLQQLCADRGDQAEILAWRVRGLDVVIDANLNATYGQAPEAAYGVKSVRRLEEALATKPDMVVIANPAAHHVETALAVIKAGCHVFIEKPLSDTWEGIEELVRLSQQQRVATYVGYQMRFHPVLRQIKQWLDEARIGRVISAQFHVGEYLPGMHPYEDYRKGYAAKREQGGGVVLTLSHELDTVLWLFGQPRSVYALGGHLSALDLDVEDTAAILLECHHGERVLPVSVYLDFVQRPFRRFCEIVGEHGTIRWDHETTSPEHYDVDAGRWTRLETGPFDRNQLFLDEMSHWLNCIEGSQVSMIPVEEGARTLRVALAVRSSLESGQRVEVSDA